MDEEKTEVEVKIEAPFLSRALDWETGLKHILAPAFLGVALGGIWQAFVMPKVGEINLPNPIHGAFFISILLSPLLYRLLLDDEPSRWKEYTLGLSTLGLLFSMLWLSGWGAVFCGGYGLCRQRVGLHTIVIKKYNFLHRLGNPLNEHPDSSS